MLFRSDIANRLCAELLLLSAEDPTRDISLYINSPGGSVTAGLAIYDTMRLIPNDVSTLGLGLAASMGQFLLGAGTPGKRFVLPHTRVLLHQGSAGIGGTAIDIEIQAENLEHTKNVMLGLIAEHSGQPVEKVERVQVPVGVEPLKRAPAPLPEPFSQPAWLTSLVPQVTVTPSNRAIRWPVSSI